MLSSNRSCSSAPSRRRRRPVPCRAQPRRSFRAPPACRAAPAARRPPAPRAASGRVPRIRTGTQTPGPAGTASEVVVGHELVPAHPAARAPRWRWHRPDLSCGSVRSSPTISSDASGCVARACANARIRSGTCRRLKIDPTYSTRGRRGNPALGKSRRSRCPAGSRGSRSADAEPLDDLARENSESVTTARAALAARRGQPAPADAFAQPRTTRDARRTTGRGSPTTIGTVSRSGAV